MKYTLQPFLSTIRAILVPSPIQAATALTSATLIFLAVSFDRIFYLIVRDEPESRYYFSQMISDKLSELSDLPRAGDLSVMLIWSLVGTAAYVLVVSLINLFLKFRETVALQQDSANTNGNPLFSLVDEYRRAVWIFIFILFASVSLFYLLGHWLDLMNLEDGIQLIRLLIGVACLAANLYVLAMLLYALRINPYIIHPSKDVIHK